MTVRQCKTLAAALAVAAAAAGCAKAPPPAPPAGPPPLTIIAPPDAKVTTPLTISVAADANPDRNGTPSQVVLRIYQLRATEKFAAADLLPLYDNETTVLGPELITRNEFVLQPSDSRALNVELSNETRFIGAIVPFRDDRNAEWRALMPVTKGGLKVDVERLRVLLASAPQTSPAADRDE